MTCSAIPSPLYKSPKKDTNWSQISSANSRNSSNRLSKGRPFCRGRSKFQQLKRSHLSLIPLTAFCNILTVPDIRSTEPMQLHYLYWPIWLISSRHQLKAQQISGSRQRDCNCPKVDGRIPIHICTLAAPS